MRAIFPGKFKYASRMQDSGSDKILLYAPPHYIGNMGDRIVTKVLFERMPDATFLYDNYFNYLFGNRDAKKLFFNPNQNAVSKAILELTEEFSKFVLLGMDGLDGFYNLNESRTKIEIATAFAQSGKSSWIVNFSWNHLEIDKTLLVALHQARDVGVRFVTRDSQSCARLVSLGVPSTVCPDFGFLISQHKSITDPETFVIGRDGRDYAVLAPSHTFRMIPRQIDSFAKIAISLRIQGLIPVIFVSVTNIRKSDSLMAHRINMRLIKLNQPKMPILVDEETLDSFLQKSRLVITGRMHVAIFALSNLVPSYILEYQGKAKGLLSDLGLESLSSINPEISDEFLSDFLDNSNQYSEILRNRIPLFIRKSKHLLSRINEE